jgi:hypothetical protein
VSHGSYAAFQMVKSGHLTKSVRRNRAADRGALPARRADVTGLGMPERHDHDSSLTIIVKRDKVSLSSNLSLKITSSGGCHENPFFI